MLAGSKYKVVKEQQRTEMEPRMRTEGQRQAMQAGGIVARPSAGAACWRGTWPTRTGWRLASAPLSGMVEKRSSGRALLHVQGPVQMELRLSLLLSSGPFSQG